MSQKKHIPIIMSSYSQKELSSSIFETIEASVGIVTERRNDIDKHDFEEKEFGKEGLREHLEKVDYVKRIGDLEEQTLGLLFHSPRFFVMKSNNFENVALAKEIGVWATPPANERRLDLAFEQNPNVYLIFSVRESGFFQGFARVRKPANHEHPPVPWSLPPTIPASVFSGIIEIDWISKQPLAFSLCNDLRNPLNDHKEVKISRDGQELDAVMAEKLCRLFAQDPAVNVPLLLNDLRISRIIEKYSRHSQRRTHHSIDSSTAKSRNSDEHRLRKKERHSSRSGGNMIPQVFFEKLVELTNLPYDEYVAAVSNGRQLTALAKLGVFLPDAFPDC